MLAIFRLYLNTVNISTQYAYDNKNKTPMVFILNVVIKIAVQYKSLLTLLV